MNTLPQVIKHRNQRVLTTSQLAQYLETDEDNIRKNYSRNKDHFVLGEDYFLLEGEELKVFKTNYVTICPVVDPHAPSLFLWTEFGTLLHVKSIGTDKAWQIYKWLRRDYYDRGEQLGQLQQPVNLAEIQAAYEQVRVAKEQLTEATTAYGQAQARFHELIEPLGDLGKALAQQVSGQQLKPVPLTAATRKPNRLAATEGEKKRKQTQRVLAFLQQQKEPVSRRTVIRYATRDCVPDTQAILDELMATGQVTRTNVAGSKVQWFYQASESHEARLEDDSAPQV